MEEVKYRNLGEISLAHNGVLFLDELPEFNKNTLEVLRGPLEDKIVNISRVNASLTYPCNFMFIASMNPCPCGFYGSKDKECTCTPQAISKYMGKISGPLLDRIDIQIEVTPVKYQKLDNTEKIEAEDESAAEAAERRFRSYLLSNTRKGNELVMSEGEALERCALWALGTAYERETRVEKAIDVYGRLVEIEENREQIATAGIRKMKLEAGKEQYSIALLTGKRVLERTGTEPEVEKLMQEYELRIQEQESGVQNGQSREEQKKEEQKQEGEINEQNVDK